MCTKEPGVIRKLDEVVINRIAAGEVVQRPANALKELLENSLDAGSNNIQVVVKGGGLKLLQIQDDGCGIRKEDLSIVCERFTTSKLETFEDLQQIGTYGFRGEALASISHVAHLTIVTKTQDSPCAFRAAYSNGKLEDKEPNTANPKPCAGNQGTTIIVEDLFYNMETRRRALRTASEEYNKILEVVTRYAVHNSKAGFSLKKHGENSNDVRTPPNSSTLDNIKILYGVQIARELLPMTCDDTAAQFKMTGYISNANYSVKKPTFLLFINGRLVDSSSLRKNIDGIYSAYLPKGSHPFIYLSLDIEPKNVDVNVHPTKHEVHFLHEDAITSAIGNAIDKILQGSNQSRTFFVQSLLPGASGISATASGNASKKKTDLMSSELDLADPSKGTDSQTTPSAKNMVRTDPKEQKLDRFFTSTPNSNSSMLKSGLDTPTLPKENRSGGGTPSSRRSSSSRRDIKLKSVMNLRDKVNADCHSVLLNVFRNHTFVGCVSRTHALIQHDTKLYMVNTTKLSAELFYQKMLYLFGNFGSLTIDDPISVRELVLVALETSKDKDTEEKSENKEEISKEIYEFLASKTPMLQDYFSLKFNAEGQLSNIPLLLDNYIPSMFGMPAYLLNLAKRVNWESEQECFETFCYETSRFYAVPPGDSKLNEELSSNDQTWKWTIEHVIYPEIKKSILPPKSFADDSTIIQLADLPSLYKVFERC